MMKLLFAFCPTFSVPATVRTFPLAQATRIQSVPGVTRAAPLVEGQAFASTSRAGAGVFVRGVTHDNLMTLEHVAVTPESSIGSLATFGQGDGVAIGSRLARILGRLRQELTDG